MSRTMRPAATMNSDQRANRTRQQIAHRATNHAVYRSCLYQVDGLADMLQNATFTSNQEHRNGTANASSSSNYQQNHPLDFGFMTPTQEPDTPTKNSMSASTSSSISRTINKPATSSYKIGKKSIHPILNSLYNAAQAKRISRLKPAAQQPDKSLDQLVSKFNNINISPTTQNQTGSKINITLSSNARRLIEEYEASNNQTRRSEAMEIEPKPFQQIIHGEEKTEVIIRRDHVDVEMVNTTTTTTTIDCSDIKCFCKNPSSFCRFAKPVGGVNMREEFRMVCEDERETAQLVEELEGMECQEGEVQVEVEVGEEDDDDVKMGNGFDMSALSEALPLR